MGNIFPALKLIWNGEDIRQNHTMHIFHQRLWNISLWFQSNTQDQILLQWESGTSATVNVLVVHAMIILLTYGAPSGETFKEGINKCNSKILAKCRRKKPDWIAKNVQISIHCIWPVISCFGATCLQIIRHPCWLGNIELVSIAVYFSRCRIVWKVIGCLVPSGWTSSDCVPCRHIWRGSPPSWLAQT